MPTMPPEDAPRKRPRVARCGTPSGWSKHQRADERPCDACAAAKREYDKRWRSSDERTKKSRLHAKAQNRAYMRLAHEFPDLYKTYYTEEKARAIAEASD